ncbi:MAG: hypothetical protein IPK07_20985 [Deltaproteobacteria bacterium]|nr:hypothetical protein [Deltaproteobacteria bacterium]
MTDRLPGFTRPASRLAGLVAALLVTAGAPPPARAAVVLNEGFDAGTLSGASAVVLDGANTATALESTVRRRGLHAARIERTAGALRSYVRYDLSPARTQLNLRFAVRLGAGAAVPSGLELAGIVGTDASKPLASVVLEPDGTLALTGDNGAGTVVTSQPVAPFDTPLASGTWCELEIRYRSGSVPQAAGIELYRDGVRVLSRTALPTAGSAQSINLGQRAAWASFGNAAATVYYDIAKADDANPVGPENDHPALVLVDRSSASRYADYASERVKGALDFWGLPYREVDLSSEAVTSALLTTADLVVIGQEHVASALGSTGQSALATAVQGGMGLVSLDPWAAEYGAPIQSLIGSPTFGASTTTLQLTTAAPATHFVVAEQPAGTDDPTNPTDSNIRTYFARPGGEISIQTLASAGTATVLATTVGVPAVVASSASSGRVVWWFVSHELWDNALDGSGGDPQGTYHPTLRIGHLHGLDDVLWRGLVWAHRKPMIWNPLQVKYAALKIDDARGRSLGGSTAFDYVDAAVSILGVPVQTSLFLDSIGVGSAAATALASLQSSKHIEISPHSFDGGDTNPAQPTSDFLFWKRQTGNSGETLVDEPWDAPTLAANWTSIDSFFTARGLTLSKWLAPHDAVAGTNNLPYLVARGIEFANTTHDLAASAGHGMNDWQTAAPFGSGCHALDYTSGGTSVFAVSTYADCAFWNFDFGVKQGSVAPVSNRDEAVSNALLQGRRAHGSRFPMLFLTHEYVLEADGFDLVDWQYILAQIHAALDPALDAEITWVTPTELARQAREHAGNRILSLSRTGNQFELLIEGGSSAGTSVEMWKSGEQRSHVPIGAFAGTSFSTPLAQCGSIVGDTGARGPVVWSLPGLVVLVAVEGARRSRRRGSGHRPTAIA